MCARAPSPSSLLSPCVMCAVSNLCKSLGSCRPLPCSGLAVLKVRYERISYTGLRCQHRPPPTAWIKRQGDNGCQEITCPPACQEQSVSLSGVECVCERERDRKREWVYACVLVISIPHWSASPCCKSLHISDCRACVRVCGFTTCLCRRDSQVCVWVSSLQWEISVLTGLMLFILAICYQGLRDTASVSVCARWIVGGTARVLICAFKAGVARRRQLSVIKHNQVMWTDVCTCTQCVCVSVIMCVCVFLKSSARIRFNYGPPTQTQTRKIAKFSLCANCLH